MTTENKSVIKKHAFQPVATKRCNYCLNLEVDLEAEIGNMDRIIRNSSLPERYNNQSLTESQLRYFHFRNQLLNCKFPFCNNQCGKER
jgi:hypothetical protein